MGKGWNTAAELYRVAPVDDWRQQQQAREERAAVARDVRRWSRDHDVEARREDERYRLERHRATLRRQLEEIEPHTHGPVSARRSRARDRVAELRRGIVQADATLDGLRGPDRSTVSPPAATDTSYAARQRVRRRILASSLPPAAGSAAPSRAARLAATRRATRTATATPVRTDAASVVGRALAGQPVAAPRLREAALRGDLLPAALAAAATLGNRQLLRGLQMQIQAQPAAALANLAEGLGVTR